MPTEVATPGDVAAEAEARAAGDAALAELVGNEARARAEADQAITDRIASIVIPSAPRAASAGEYGAVHVDEFSGATDDERMDNALAYAAACTYVPAVAYARHDRPLELRRPPKLFKGASFLGSPVAVEQPRSGNPYAGMIRNRVPDGVPLFYAETVIDDVRLQGVTVDGSGNADAVMIGNTASGGFRRAVLRDVCAANIRDALGMPSQQLLLTACTIDGDNCINNYTRSAVTIGGSDNALGRWLLDTPPAMMKGAYHVKLAWLSKSHFQTYLTAEGDEIGVWVAGNESCYDLTVVGTIEGRNTSKPNTATLVVHDGGEALYLIGVHNATGLPVQVKKGRATFLAPEYHHGTRSEDLPFIEVASTVPAADVQVALARRGGPWKGLPVVKGPATVDGSVRRV